jgi:hypothetical protein
MYLDNKGRCSQEECIIHEAKYQEAEKFWSNGDYNAFLTLEAQIAKEVLPNTYPEWQNKSVSYGQIKYLVNSIENATTRQRIY